MNSFDRRTGIEEQAPAQSPQPIGQPTQSNPHVPQSDPLSNVARCDVCSTKIGFADGYALTTREVVTSPAYWNHWRKRIKRAFGLYVTKDLAGMELLGRNIAIMAGQPTGWLVCEKCSGMFEFNKVMAKEFAAKKANPPGCGPVDYEEVLAVVADGLQKGLWEAAVLHAAKEAQGRIIYVKQHKGSN